jgi:glycerol-3-phosphate dehydrogenase
MWKPSASASESDVWLDTRSREKKKKREKERKRESKREDNPALKRKVLKGGRHADERENNAQLCIACSNARARHSKRYLLFGHAMVKCHSD